MPAKSESGRAEHFHRNNNVFIYSELWKLFRLRWWALLIRWGANIRNASPAWIRRRPARHSSRGSSGDAVPPLLPRPETVLPPDTSKSDELCPYKSFLTSPPKRDLAASRETMCTSSSIKEADSLDFQYIENETLVTFSVGFRQTTAAHAPKIFT